MNEPLLATTCVVSACGVSPKPRAAAHCEHLIIELTTYLSKRAKLVFLPVIMLCYEEWYQKTLPDTFDTHPRGDKINCIEAKICVGETSTFSTIHSYLVTFHPLSRPLTVLQAL